MGKFPVGFRNPETTYYTFHWHERKLRHVNYIIISNHQFHDSKWNDSIISPVSNDNIYRFTCIIRQIFVKSYTTLYNYNDMYNYTHSACHSPLL